MKTYHKQYVECHNEGLVVPGTLMKFKDHPEILPPPWHRAAKRVVKSMKENPEAGLTPMDCLRFGGQCRSGHEECMKMRGIVNP